MNISDKFNKDRCIYYMSQSQDYVRLHWDCISEVTGLLDALADKFTGSRDIEKIYFFDSIVYLDCNNSTKTYQVYIKEYMEFIATYGE